MNAISIKRTNFGRAGDRALLLGALLIFSLGIMGVVLNWKGGICAISALLIFKALRSWIKRPYFIPVVLSALLLIALSHFGAIPFGELFLTALGLSAAFFLKPLYLETKVESDFEIFYLDTKELKCLALDKASDYKAYATNPKAFLKTFPAHSIKSFVFKRAQLLLTIESVLVRPLELSAVELTRIQDFTAQHFPNLLASEAAFKAASENENRHFLNKLLIFSPVLPLAILIYFLADNGRNTLVTAVLLALMVLLPAVIFKRVQKKK